MIVPPVGGVDRQGDDIQIEGRTDRLVAVQGQIVVGLVVPLQVASPAGESITRVGCSFYAHHVAVVVGASRGGRDRAAGRRSDRQGDEFRSKVAPTDLSPFRVIVVGLAVPLRSPVQPVKV